MEYFEFEAKVHAKGNAFDSGGNGDMEKTPDISCILFFKRPHVFNTCVICLKPNSAGWWHFLYPIEASCARIALSSGYG